MLAASLVDYISQNLKAGHHPNQIRLTLINSGWPAEQVDQAMNHVLSQQRARPEPSQPPRPPQAQARQHGQPKPLGIRGKFRTVLFHPDQLFEAVKNEQGYEPPVKFYLLIAFINLIFVNLFFLVLISIVEPSSLTELSSNLGMEAILALVLQSIFSANITVIISIALTFLGAGYLHLYVRLFGGRGGFQNTYKALIYSSAPSAFSWPAVFLVLISPLLAIAAIVVILLWAFILEVKGLSKLHDISGARAAAIIIIMVVVTWVIFFLLIMILITMILAPSLLNLVNTGNVHVSGICVGGTTARISMTNLGSEPVSLSGCSDPGSVGGISKQCGDITVSRSDGGSMNGYFDKEVLGARQGDMLGIAVFRDENCTSLGSPSLCKYSFSFSEQQISHDVSVSCDG